MIFSYRFAVTKSHCFAAISRGEGVLREGPLSAVSGCRQAVQAAPGVPAPVFQEGEDHRVEVALPEAGRAEQCVEFPEAVLYIFW